MTLWRDLGRSIGVLAVFAIVVAGMLADDRSPAKRTSDPLRAERDRQQVWVMNGQDMVRSRLRDGESARFRGSYFYRGSDGIPLACGEVNGKNAYGAYRGWQRYISAGKPEMTWLEEEVADFGTLWSRFCL